MYDRNINGQMVLGAVREFASLTKGRQTAEDIACESLPIVARGVVVDRAGKPVTGISLGVQCRQWQWLPLDATGAFTLRAPKPLPARADLRLPDGWFFAEPPYAGPSITLGEGALRVVVQPAARLRFRAEGLPKSPLHQFEFALLAADDTSAHFDLRPDLSGTELRIPAGHWHFVVRHGNEEVLRYENVRADEIGRAHV